jgi:hypothetical protein
MVGSSDRGAYYDGGGCWYQQQFEVQTDRLIAQCNLPKAEHFKPIACSFCETKGDWPFDYDVLINYPGGVFMNFLKTIIAHIPGCQALYDVQKKIQPTERLTLENSLLPMLEKIVPMDEVSMRLSVDYAVKNATSKEHGGLTVEGLNTLGSHALHAVLAFVVNGEEPGLGIDLTKFTTFNDFEAFISPKFIAKIIAIFLKTGSSTLLHHIVYFPLLKNNRLMKMFVL